MKYLLKTIGITGLFLFLLGYQTTALGHARWKLGSQITPPRNDSTGLKTAPCGGVPRTAVSKSYKPGQQITVEFEETINHLGYFEIYFFPANDTVAGTPTPLATIQDTQNTQVANGVNHQFTAQITLPTAECEQCTLQLIQVMQDQGPTGPKSFYYSCADIRVSNNPPPPTPSPAPVPTPTPTPAPSPAPAPVPGAPPAAPSPSPSTGVGTGTGAPSPQTQAPAGKPDKPAGLKLENLGGTK